MGPGQAEAEGSTPRSGSPSIPIDVGEGTPVLLVHGQPGTGGAWESLAGLLEPDFRVIAPNRPGWGSHPRPATTLAGNAAALARLLASCDITPEHGGPVVVVGHSLGGGIAIELALTRPDLVGALVLIGSVGVAAAVTGMDRLLAVPVVGDGVLRAGSVALRRTVAGFGRLSKVSRAEMLVERANRYPAVRAVIAEGGRQMGGRDRRSFLVEQRALIDETASIERRLPSLRVPTAVIHGTADHVVSPHVAAELAGAIAGAELLLRPNLGHRLPFEEAEFVAGVVRRYASLMASGR